MPMKVIKHPLLYRLISSRRSPAVGVCLRDEKLVAQLTSRRKLYDSKGREKLESKADLRARGVESPDRADALIGAIVLGQETKIDWKALLEDWKRIKRQMHLGIGNAIFPRRHISFR
jgi:hypothetical protein